MSSLHWVIVISPILLVLLGIGVPIWLSLSITGIIGISVIAGFGHLFVALGHVSQTALTCIALLVIPMFIMMGNFASAAGISSSAFKIGNRWLSKLPGGVAMATVLACAGFAAACGSSPATAAAVGKIAIPEMKKLGYNDKLATGVVAAGGTLGILIPPSIVLVIYGVITETSIGKLLVAGVIPGIISFVVYCIGIYFMIKKNPDLAPPSRTYSWKERFSSLKGGWGIIAVFTIIIGGIYFGLSTPTEAAVIGTVAVFIMMVFSSKSLKKQLKIAYDDTIVTTSMMFLIVLSAEIFGYFLKIGGVGQALSIWVNSLSVPPLMVVLAALLIYIPLGMFLEPMAILLMTLPILHPIIVTQLGFDSVWFGILITKLIETGLITPPVGLNVYIIGGICPDVPLEDIFKGIMPFLLLNVVIVAILMLFPTLTTWLPSMM